MRRKQTLALFAAVVLLAIPAATAHAVGRMQIGFYDDPSFRWAADPNVNLAAAHKANASIIHVLANWAAIAPTKPSNPTSGSDPAYHLSDLDALVRSAQYYDMQVLLTISETPKWANGGQTPNHPPQKLSDLTNFSQMLASRYNGTHSGFGTVSFFSVWNEPNLGLFLTPQFSGNTIVSPGIYAKLFMAAYTGIKKGNPNAEVAAGETSNRGKNHPTASTGTDSVAPATFARLLAQVAPKLPFDAWATHPYPSEYRLGPTQKVAFPNVSFSTMTEFGDSLQTWFKRRVPIWVTEYAEQTTPEYAGGVSYAQQATDAKTALKLAAANPYVEMFVWFIFRDSNSSTWFSGLETTAGKKKPAYNVFAATAKTMVGQSLEVPAGKRFSVTLGVPGMTYFNAIGAKVGVTYKLYRGKQVVALAQPLLRIQANGSITIPVNYLPSVGKTYTLTAVVNDTHGNVENRTVLIQTAVPAA